ncbi:MAG: tRNA 2-thiouridine(34) synthase MnmA [bacterium]
MAGAKTKVLMAMSGGVDSSVGAAVLLRAGYEVVGVFMRLGSPGEAIDQLVPGDGGGSACSLRVGAEVSGRTVSLPVRLGHQGCCSVSDAADARLVAAQLGIPFYVANFKKDFGRIMDYFAGEYAAGRTPNPCVRCNDWLKFGKLHEYAEQIDAGFVASGHYARVGRGADGEPQLMRGVDEDKDQSYVLFGVPRERLGGMLLPVGEMRKPEVRRMAEELGLPVFNKPDSQEICFVPDNDYGSFVDRRLGASAAGRGVVLDPSGKVVGEHAGHHRFTIGQRRGVGVALGYPVFVVGKDATANTVTVGPREMLLASSCVVGEANWLGDEPRGWERVWVKHRYNSEGVRAEGRVVEAGEGRTHSGRGGRFEVRFEAAQEAVTPGQALVVYDGGLGKVVRGGGWIEGVGV